MAEALLLGVLASGLQQAATNLWTRFQQVKGTDAESKELQEFVTYLEENSSLRISSSKEVRTMLRKRLDAAKTKLKEWSSKNSGFLARSSAERVLELRAQRQFVADTIFIANLKIADDTNLGVQQILELLKNEKRAHNSPRKSTGNGHQGTTPALEAPRGRGEPIKKKPSERKAKVTSVTVPSKLTGPPTPSKTTQPSSGDKGQHNSTGQQPSTSAHGDRKRPALSPQPRGISKSIEELSLGASSSTKPPKSGATAGSALKTGKLTNSGSKKRRVDLWQQLWVPIDSKKQANDIKERLRGLEGVKEVHIDQPSQKVSVLLREGSNISKLTKALIENAQLSKDKRKPTPWAERPR